MYIAGANRPVDTGDSYFGEIRAESISGTREAKFKLRREKIEGIEIYNGNLLEARIEYARYIVDCPNCSNAEFAFEDELFMCSSCHNSDVGGKVRRAKLPKDRELIENVLGKRPINNRHWFSSETLEDLEKENLDNGLS